MQHQALLTALLSSLDRTLDPQLSIFSSPPSTLHPPPSTRCTLNPLLSTPKRALTSVLQVFFGKYDMTIHSESIASSAQLWTELRGSVSLIPNSSGGNGAASFGHIMYAQASL